MDDTISASSSTTTSSAGTELLAVPGVTLAAVKAGIRYPDRLDLVALRFAPGTVAAAVFTQNAFCAAPVSVAREHLRATGNKPRLLLINTGNANAGTGAAGLVAARECCAAAAKVEGLRPEEVLPFSTGVIGEDLPVERVVAGQAGLHEGHGPDNWQAASWGILTTDTKPKAASREITLAGEQYALTGIAKGAGMLRPDMATMLAFLATDAPFTAELLDTMLRRAVEASFHRITIDGDTSTNDAVVLAATAAGRSTLCNELGSPLARAFTAALESICVELAQGLVRDGEGASKFVEIAVSGGADAQECLDVAFTVAHSPLVKTAFFAADPNWGRVLAAIGRSGLSNLDVSGVTLDINGLSIAEHGCRARHYDEQAVAAVMAKPELQLQIDLGRGVASESVWTSDFSYDYVRINAEYRS